MQCRANKDINSYLFNQSLNTDYLLFHSCSVVQPRIFSIVDLQSVWLRTVYYCIVCCFLQARNYFRLFFCNWSKIDLYWLESTWLQLLFFQRNIIVCIWTNYIVNDQGLIQVQSSLRHRNITGFIGFKNFKYFVYM